MQACQARCLYLRHSTAKMPSVQSLVCGSMRPNIWGAVIALGFMRQITCLVPSSVSAPASTSIIEVLPDPLGPTSMMPCRTCSTQTVLCVSMLPLLMHTRGPAKAPQSRCLD